MANSAGDIMAQDTLTSRIAAPLALIGVIAGPIALASMTKDILVWNDPIDGFVAYWGNTIQPLLANLLAALPSFLNIPALDPMGLNYLLMGIVMLPSSARAPTILLHSRLEDANFVTHLIVFIIAAPFLIVAWPLAVLTVIGISRRKQSDTRYRTLALAPFLLFGVMWWFNEAWLQ